VGTKSSPAKQSAAQARAWKTELKYENASWQQVTSAASDFTDNDCTVTAKLRVLGTAVWQITNRCSIGGNGSTAVGGGGGTCSVAWHKQQHISISNRSGTVTARHKHSTATARARQRQQQHSKSSSPTAGSKQQCCVFLN